MKDVQKGFLRLGYSTAKMKDNVDEDDIDGDDDDDDDDDLRIMMLFEMSSYEENPFPFRADIKPSQYAQ